jgi:hypothetical protein
MNQSTMNTPNKSMKKKCDFCNKKLKMIHFTCKCNQKFCILHQNPHSHICSFDNKTFQQNKIKKDNPQTVHQKVVKI